MKGLCRSSTYFLREVDPELQTNRVRAASLMDRHFSMND